MNGSTDAVLYRPLPSAVALTSTQARTLVDTHASKTFIKTLVSELLPPTADGQANFDKKLKNKSILLSNVAAATAAAASAGSQSSQAKEKVQRRLRHVQKSLSSKDKKQLHLFQIPAQSVRYDRFERLHSLWLQYMTDVVGADMKDPTKCKEKVVGEKLLKADFHGCKLRVLRCRNPSLVGKHGIVMMETQETFRVVTPSDFMTTISKRGTVFALDLFGRIIHLHGNQFAYRASERVVRKFKGAASIEL